VPLYDYDCANCGRRFEILRGVHADDPTACPLCGGGPVKKAFATPAIHFKGSGWAKKERRATASTTASKGSGDGEPANTSAGSDGDGSSGGSADAAGSDGSKGSDAAAAATATASSTAGDSSGGSSSGTSKSKPSPASKADR
jgi:putative FmdB family regulatory protein